MKKVLAVSLFLMMAVSAKAGIVWKADINAETRTAVIRLVAENVDVTQACVSELAVNGGTIQTGTWNAGFTKEHEGGTLFSTLLEPGEGFLNAYASAPTGSSVTGNLFWFSYAFGESDTVSATIASSSNYGTTTKVITPAGVNIGMPMSFSFTIPEPATCLLLGLGCLMLRRRI